MAIYDSYDALIEYIDNVLSYDPDQLRLQLISPGGDKIVA
ncbi:hypothetical protein BN137_2387 [Cronobacter condimenti 1330]|uniref:Uncharacterized protein n=1 Tax=Cronobacter condimenti 1330 TaxID=1073999 RepID=K8A106_9ENTR|nr:hypothetical protein BN137_2387 [Cronobacter condimenti 1330]